MLCGGGGISLPFVVSLYVVVCIYITKYNYFLSRILMYITYPFLHQ